MENLKILKMESFDEDEIQGSKRIFFLFRLINYIMILLGILVIIIAIYTYLLLKSFTIIDVAIIGIGLFIIGVGYFSLKLKNSLVGLGLYIIITLFYLFCQLIACLILASSPEAVINYILDHANPDIRNEITNETKSYVNNMRYIMGFMLVITVLDVGVAFWYRKSLKDVINSNPNSVLPYSSV